MSLSSCLRGQCLCGRACAVLHCEAVCPDLQLYVPSVRVCVFEHGGVSTES